MKWSTWNIATTWTTWMKSTRRTICLRDLPMMTSLSENSIAVTFVKKHTSSKRWQVTSEAITHLAAGYGWTIQAARWRHRKPNIRQVRHRLKTVTACRLMAHHPQCITWLLSLIIVTCWALTNCRPRQPRRRSSHHGNRISSDTSSKRLTFTHHIIAWRHRQCHTRAWRHKTIWRTTISRIICSIIRTCRAVLLWTVVIATPGTTLPGNITTPSSQHHLIPCSIASSMWRKQSRAV